VSSGGALLPGRSALSPGGANAGSYHDLGDDESKEKESMSTSVRGAGGAMRACAVFAQAGPWCAQPSKRSVDIAQTAGLGITVYANTPNNVRWFRR
jgi:hypothetical protein